MKWARLTRDHRFLQMICALYIPSLWLYVTENFIISFNRTYVNCNYEVVYNMVLGISTSEPIVVAR